MTTKGTRITAAALASLLAALTALTLFSCSETTVEEETPASAGEPDVSVLPEETEEEETTREQIKDGLPDTLDYESAVITVLARSRNWFTGEMYVEDLTGEVWNDAVYDRNIKVEDRLNVSMNYRFEDDTNSLINRNVKAGSDEFSFHAGSAVDVVEYGIAGNYYNLLGDYPVYIDLSRPWWSHYYTEQSSILGKVFFATGDLFTSLIRLSFVTFVNKQMVEDYGLENPYDLVRSGEWTIDKEMSMVSDIWVDLNPNEKQDPKDIVGTCMAGEIGLDLYWSAFDLTICQKDENDMPSLAIDVDKMSSVVEKLLEYYTRPGVYRPLNNADAEQDQVAKMLANDKMIFAPLRIMHTEQIRDMESDYGLMPLPKWNEEQTDYYTFVHDQYTVGGIPVSVRDPAMVSAVVECMAADSYRYVTPAYYDVVLNGKYLRDPDSTEMLEIAMAGIKIDFGWIHTRSFSNIAQVLLRDTIYGTRQGKSDGNFASRWAATKTAKERDMENLIEAVKKNNT